jgi:hypothetical protein
VTRSVTLFVFSHTAMLVLFDEAGRMLTSARSRLAELSASLSDEEQSHG